MPHNGISRRRFLAGSAAIGAGTFLSLSGCSNTQRLGNVRGANEDIRVAIIGFRGRGQNLLEEVRAVKGTRIVALCDADTKVIDREKKKFDKRGEKVATYQDMRKVFDRHDIDAIVTATPNHWHALATVWACQSGKDVYVEKPVCHEIWEGRKMIEAAAKYGRIVQAGTQRRSDKSFAEMIAYLHSGQIGKILYVYGLCYRDRDSIGKVSEPTPIPSNIDYDLWCGPAPKEPLMRKNLHYDWHWVWPTGNGDIGNQGIHEVDQSRWIAGYDKLPPRVFSFGGRYVWDDDGTTPNTQISIWDYPIPIIHEVRNLRRSAVENVMDNYHGIRVGVFVQCEGGYFAGGNQGGWVYDTNGQRIKQFPQDGAGTHMANFISAVRSRKMSDLNAPINEGHLSSSMCHMANISYRLGRKVSPSQTAEMLRSDRLAMGAWDRIRQHLAANNVNLDKDLPTMGTTLEFDPVAERFTGLFAEQANNYVRRDYRKPFVIPDVV